MNVKKKIACALAIAVTASAGVALATAPDGLRGPMPGPHGPHGPGAPSAEMLATIDGLNANQQADLRKILREQRDAEDTLRTRLRGEREALDLRERNERDRIADQTTQKLHSALGEDGYRAYAEWATQRGPGPRPPGAHGAGPDRHGEGPRPGMHDEGPGPTGEAPPPAMH